MKRETWGSKLGFIFAAAGSAVGLANIWRFPYVVGSSGGAVFVAVYLICLALIGFPVFMAEVLIGRSTHLSPSGAFLRLGVKKFWGFCGKCVVLTGFIVSAFYSAIAAWIVGYLFEALSGRIISFENSNEAMEHFNSLVENPIWCLSFHAVFIVFCSSILLFGVRKGIERGNTIFMPLLYLVLTVIVVYSLMQPNAWEGVRYLFSPDWNEITPKIFLLALGQAFFTLSLGQGTMVTYGSYLKHQDNLITSCMPVALMDTFVSLFSAVAVFAIVFSAGLEPDAGPSLIFSTLPLVFSKVPLGWLLATLFFLLVFFAAVTSEISAMEPSIAYLIDNHGFKRKNATAIVAAGAFVIGVPCALSTNLLSNWKIFDLTIIQGLDFLTTGLLIPLGGFAAVVLVGWVWGIDKASKHLSEGAESLFFKCPWIRSYFKICIKFVAPLLILFVFLNAIGLFG